MEDNLRENILPQDSDLPESGAELTRSVSDSPPSSSSVIVDGRKKLPVCCSHAAMGASTEWTNEKHNLYLDSLERSFVNELYHSMRLRGTHRQKNFGAANSSQEFSFKSHNSSDQFMVLQDGCLRNTGLQRNEAFMESTADSHVTTGSPWICHSTSAGKSCNLSPKMLTLKSYHASARSSEQNFVCHRDLVGSSTEISGQNFVYEDHGEKLRNESVPKRIKRAAADASNNDQLVPSGISNTQDVSVVHGLFCERKRKGIISQG